MFFLLFLSLDGEHFHWFIAIAPFFRELFAHLWVEVFQLSFFFCHEIYNVYSEKETSKVKCGYLLSLLWWWSFLGALQRIIYALPPTCWWAIKYFIEIIIFSWQHPLQTKERERGYGTLVQCVLHLIFDGSSDRFSFCSSLLACSSCLRHKALHIDIYDRVW